MALFACRVAASPTMQMYSGGKKRRSFLALLFAAGGLRRSLPSQLTNFPLTSIFLVPTIST